MKHWKNSDFFGFFYLRTPQNDTSGYHVLPKIIFSDSSWLELHFMYLSFLNEVRRTGRVAAHLFLAYLWRMNLNQNALEKKTATQYMWHLFNLYFYKFQWS